MKKPLVLQLFALFALSLTIQAQNELDRLLEDLSLTPHYNEKGQVDYSYLGDIMRVNNTYDDAGRIIKQTIYTFDKYDYVREKKSETSYTYKDARLVEKKTEQTLPYRRNRDTQYYKTTVNREVISFDKETMTDTIWNYIAWPSLQAESSIASRDTVMSVRYLNKHLLPDSTVVRHISSRLNSEEYSQHIYYTYDNQQRLTEAKTFTAHQGQLEPSPNDVMQVEYKKDKTIYTGQREREAWYESDDSEDTSPIIIDKIAYTVLVDQQKRVKERNVTVNGNIVFRIRHDYDTHGNASSQYEHHDISRVEELYSLSLPGSIHIGKNAWYTCQTNADGMRTLSLDVLSEESSERIRVGEIKTKFSPSGLLLFYETTKYDREDGTFDETETITVNYHDADSLSGELVRTETYPYDGELETTPQEKIVFKKDTEDRYLYKESLSYSEDEGWTPRKKEIYQYNQNGYMTRDESYDYDSYDQTWYLKSLEEYTRDDKNRILSVTEKRPENGNWVNDVRYNRLFNDNHQQTMNESFRWDNNEWKAWAKDSTVYDAQGEPAIQFKFRWEKDGWVYARKDEKTSVRQSKKYLETEVNSVWKNDRWEVHYDSYRINDFAADSTYNRIMNWDDDTEQLFVSSLDKGSRQGDEQVYESYRWNYDRKALAGKDKYITVKDTLSISGAFLSRQYYDWDNASDKWIPLFRRRNVVREEAREIREYDTYNRKSNEWTPEVRIEELSSDSLRREAQPLGLPSALPPMPLIELSDESNESIDTITITQTRWLWNRSKQKWQATDQLISNYRTKHSRYAYQIIRSTYNPTSSQWTPELLWRNTTHNNTDNEQFYQWNVRSQAWEDYYKKERDLYGGYNHYQWDAAASKWNELSLWNSKSYDFVSELFDKFLLEDEYDYENRERND